MTGGVMKPRYSVCEWSTPHNTVWEDIDQIARTGGEGIGLWEGKFADGGDDDRIRAAMAQHGLAATLVVPRLHTVLHGPISRPDAPRDPRERTDLICESVRRLSEFDPVAVVIGPGTSGDPQRPNGPVEAVEEAVCRVADVAADHGVTIAFELLAERFGSPLGTLPAVADFLDRVDRPNVGIFFDIIHSWCEPNLHENLRRYADRFVGGIHINDAPVEERSLFDRKLPGDGRAVAPEIMATLIEAGFDGWYELEVFSDDGTFGNAFPDSLWAMPHEELLKLGREAFERSYARALAIVAERASDETAR